MRYLFGECTLDTEQYVLYRADHALPLQPKVFQVLHYLLTHRDRVIAKVELSGQVWPQQFISDATLEGVIKAVRHAVGDDGRTQWCIQTRRGQGYRFVAPVALMPGAETPLLAVRHSLAPVEGGTLAPPGPPASVSMPRPTLPDAERRQLTVMGCDLGGGTTRAGQLDPEDLREVLQAYREMCTEVIAPFGGHLATCLGDAVLVYFGYPQAQDDAPQQAVRAGLRMIEAIARLPTRLTQTWGIQLAGRVGIHTGLVVAGALGVGDARDPQAIVGEAPTLAARLQALAAPHTVVLSAATARLVEGYFTLETLGLQVLPGVARPVPVYRVVGESAAQTRLDVARTRGLTPLVGREPEVALLLERWGLVKDGLGQVVLLSGEPGIGKSRLVQVLHERVAGEPSTRLVCRCASSWQHSALYPVIDLWQRTLQWQRDDTPDAKLQKLEGVLAQSGVALPEVVPLLASLLSVSLGERYPPLALTPERQKQKTLETLLAVLLALAAHRPVLFIVEDLHWVDPSTLAWLDLLIDQVPTARICLILVFRPDFHPSWAPYAHLIALTLSRLPRPQVERMIAGLTRGKALPAAVRQQLVVRTDGVPLFVEELTKMVLESGWLREQEDHYDLTEPLSPLAIPATLHDSLLARLDRLGSVKAVAQLAATIGRAFPYEVLQAIAPVDEAYLQQALARLVTAEVLYQRGLPPQATYVFKHALLQEAAYASVLKGTRRRYHQQLVQVFATRFPEIADTQPELLAQHATAAGLSAQAVGYWLRAGQRAIGRSAYVEALSHLTQGLEVVQTLPATRERTQHELGLQTAVGAAVIAMKGYAAPEVEQAYTRARALCQHLGDTARLLRVLLGLQAFYVVRGQFQTARELGEQCLALVQHEPNPTRLLHVHYALGVTWYHLGAFVAARAHLEQGMALAEAPHHRPPPHLQDPGVICLAYGAWALGMLGYPAQALARVQDARRLAEERAHPFSLAFALHCVSCVHHFRREAQDTQEQTQALMTLATDQGFPFWQAYATVVHGWALVARGRDEGLTYMQQGLGTWQALGAEVGRTWGLGLLAEAYGRVGQPEAGLTVLADALAGVARTGERFWEAELYRLQGVLLLQARVPRPASARVAASARLHPTDLAAEACFHQALTIARRQQAKSWELRAALSLSRLWQQQGKRAAAYELLAPIYGWFTEGFDTADLKDAKALLDALA